MSTYMWATVFGLLGAGLLTAMAIPQLIKIIRGGTDGVSIGTWVFIVIATLAWLGYGLQIASPALIVGNILTGVGALLVVGILMRRRYDWSGGVTLASLLLATFGAISVFVALPVAVVSVLAIGFGLLSRWPQLLSSWQHARLHQVTDVSIAAWAVSAVGQAAWLAYGILAHDIPAIVVNVILVLVGAAIVACELRAGRGRKDAIADVLQPTRIAA